MERLIEHKLIYLARRNPALTAAGFAQAWREHSQYAATFGQEFRQHFKSVHQCLKLDDADVPSSFVNDFDGGNLLTMVSREGLLAARYQPGTTEALRQDEKRVFAEQVDGWTMGAEGFVVGGTDPEGGRGNHVILSYLFARELDVAAFAAASQERAACMAGLRAVSKAQRIVWNRVVDVSTVYGFGAIIEMWFADIWESRRAARDPAVLEALEQPDIADPKRGARLLTKINPRDVEAPK